LVLQKGWRLGWAKPNVPFVCRQFKIFCALEKKLKTEGSAMSVGLLAVRLQYGLYVVVHLSK
jgi:hypothetical protein